MQRQGHGGPGRSHASRHQSNLFLSLLVLGKSKIGSQGNSGLGRAMVLNRVRCFCFWLNKNCCICPWKILLYNLVPDVIIEDVIVGSVGLYRYAKLL
jgi:hypothetical protein